MAWFRDHLYVSATRDNLALIKLRYPFEVPLTYWPVPVPGDLWDLDLRARIFRYDPRADTWSETYRSPTTRGRNGLEVPLSVAFRSMVVFQGPSDDAPALYAPTFAPALLSGSVMLRSADGARFDVVSAPGFGVGDWAFRSFRGLIPFKKLLFAAPTMGVQAGKPNVAGVAVVLVSSDPARGEWRVANAPNFGNPRNLTVFEMAVFEGHLYANTFNPFEGFEVWKTDAEGNPPFRWQRVLSHGAYRGKLNEGGASMVPFRGHLYVGTGIQNGGYDRIYKVGPAAPELIRVAPDDSWELIVGEPRMTPDGVKVPLSGMGPGFHNPFSGYFWTMCEHDGWLYLGTYDYSVFLRYARLSNVPEWLCNVLDRIGPERFVRRWGGFDLWRSYDGVRWIPVSRNGLGNPFNYGARTMVSTEHGLFVGATNPFGPEVAVQRVGGWLYEPNPDGGLEIWLGSRDRAGEGGGAVPERGPVALSVPGTVVVRGDERNHEASGRQLIEEYYGGSGFRHVGFWREGVHDARTACENLVEEVLSLLGSKGGSILDVGCGLGATTRHLLKYYPPATVTGVCVDKHELQACRSAVPGVRFTRSHLPWLPFPDDSFDSAVAFESFSYGGIRERLLREVLRVIRPGGALVFSDVLVAEGGDRERVTDPDEYRGLLERVGYRDAAVLDETDRCWVRFRAHASRHFGVKILACEIDSEVLRGLNAALPGRECPVEGYVIGVARKPSETAEKGR